MVACQGGFSLATLSPGAASFLSTQHEELMFQSGRLHADSFFFPSTKSKSHKIHMVQNCEFVGILSVFLVMQCIIDHAGSYLCTIRGGRIVNREYGGGSKCVCVHIRRVQVVLCVCVCVKGSLKRGEQ